MKSVTEKITTQRVATAVSILKTRAETIRKLVENDLPKKDAIIVARTAGVMAAKRTPDWIPYCHPLPIDSVSIQFEIHKVSVTVTATVEAIWKTGVEMEALTAASAAALTLYDMLKPVDTELEITSTKLIEKHGGKSDFAAKIPKDLTAAVLVSSDGTYAGNRKDKSGMLIKEKLESYGIKSLYEVLPDNQELMAAKLRKLCSEDIRFIITTGGTGMGPKDVTVEATREVIDREIPGIMEAARSYGQERTPYAMLSRGLAGQKGKTLILNLPGSSNGVKESLNAIFPAIFHTFYMMKGFGH